MTLKVGAAVRTLLNASTALVAKVGDRIYPIIADDTQMPFIIYSRVGLTPSHSKDGSSKDSVFMTVRVVGEYGESIDIAELVINAIKGKRGIYSGVNIDTVRVSDASEGWDDNSGYVQDITFEFIINK